MKEYIRTTHNFNNETREWEYRGDREGEKFIEWNDSTVRDKLSFRQTKWSFGVHALKSDMWMSINWVVDETIEEYKGHASDRTEEFLEFIKTDTNYREIIQKDVEKELEYLIELDMVRGRDIK